MRGKSVLGCRCVVPAARSRDMPDACFVLLVIGFSFPTHSEWRFLVGFILYNEHLENFNWPRPFLERVSAAVAAAQTSPSDLSSRNGRELFNIIKIFAMAKSTT